MRCFINTTLLLPEGPLPGGVLAVEDGTITYAGQAAGFSIPPDLEIVDLAGLLVAPGLVDVQLNGGFGHDFTQNPETIWAVAAELPRFGVTSFLPTIITSPLEQIARAQAVLAAGPPPGFRGARPLGLHLEGPFINPAKKGAHNPAFIRPPDPDLAAGWSPENGVRLVTLAPEMPGAHAVIQRLVDQRVVVSAGHSMATLEEGRAAIAAGVRSGTHLFNAMPGVHHRDPGLIAALLEDERVTIGFIPDGIHVELALLKLVFRLVGPQRLNLVSDAMAALGLSDGRTRIGSREVFVKDGVSRLTDGTLAGSAQALDQGIRNLANVSGAGLAEIWPTVSTTPLRLLGLDHTLGRLVAGYPADFLLLDDNLMVKETIIGGKVSKKQDFTN